MGDLNLLHLSSLWLTGVLKTMRCVIIDEDANFLAEKIDCETTQTTLRMSFRIEWDGVATYIVWLDEQDMPAVTLAAELLHWNSLRLNKSDICVVEIQLVKQHS